MGSQLFGLFCLLLMLAAIFYLWSQAVTDRTKHVDTAPSPPEPPRDSESPARAIAYSLAPPSAPHALASAQKASDPIPVATPTISAASASEDAAPSKREIDDELAKTHIEIARQFFAMSDFEGAAEMARLVIENEAASPQQKSDAEQLIHESA